MPHNRAFAQVDVFSSEPYRGNPVAVILDAEGLSDSEMARIANWTNLSETTFVLPPANPDADYRLRIFTPSRELPFAGHPTLGSAAAWLAAGGVPRSEGTVVQECGVGLVNLRRGGPTSPSTDVETPSETLSFAAPDPLRTGALEAGFVEQIAAALHIDPGEILSHQWVDNGPGWAAVRLASAQQVLDIEPDFAQIPDTKLGVLGSHPDGSEHEYEIRAFVPGAGVAEDPVTGSLNASVAQWLIGSGLAPEKYTVTQGTALGRAGVIEISRDDDEVWVGGQTTVCLRGTAFA